MNRGRPLAWSLREQIKQRVSDGERKAAVARVVGVSRVTVYKYGCKKTVG